MVNKSIGLKVLIFPLSLAFTVMMIIFFIKPALSEMAENRASLKANEDELVLLQAKTSQLENMRKEMLTLENKDLVAVALPEKENVDDYLNELYQRAARSGVLLDEFSVGGENSKVSSGYICGADSAYSADPSLAESTPVSGETSGDSGSSGGAMVPVAAPSCVKSDLVEFSVKGNWDQIMNFCRFISDSNRIANISDIAMTVSKTPEGAESDLISAKIGVNIYDKPKILSSFEKVSTLTGQEGLKTAVLKKMAEELIYSPYTAPFVSESETRNIFK